MPRAGYASDSETPSLSRPSTRLFMRWELDAGGDGIVSSRLSSADVAKGETALGQLQAILDFCDRKGLRPRWVTVSIPHARQPRPRGSRRHRVRSGVHPSQDHRVGRVARCRSTLTPDAERAQYYRLLQDHGLALYFVTHGRKVNWTDPATSSCSRPSGRMRTCSSPAARFSRPRPPTLPISVNVAWRSFKPAIREIVIRTHDDGTFDLQIVGALTQPGEVSDTNLLETHRRPTETRRLCRNLEVWVDRAARPRGRAWDQDGPSHSLEEMHDWFRHISAISPPGRIHGRRVEELLLSIGTETTYGRFSTGSPTRPHLGRRLASSTRHRGSAAAGAGLAAEASRIGGSWPAGPSTLACRSTTSSVADGTRGGRHPMHSRSRRAEASRALARILDACAG